MTDDLPDALAEALGGVISDLRKEWKKELEVLTAESRATIAELRATNTELLSALRDGVHVEVKRVDAAIAAIRVPEDGKSITLDDVRPILDEAIAAIRVPEDGKSITLDDVRPILDEAIAAIRVPEDGKSITLDDVRPILDEAVAAIRVPEDGKSIEPETVKAMVDEAVAAIRVPEDGKSVTLEELQPLIDEAATQLTLAVNDDVAKAVSALEARVGIEVAERVERAVAAIPVPKNGDSVTIEDVRPLLETEMGTLRSLLEVDAAAVRDKLGIEVREAIAAIPVPKNGDSVTIEDVQPIIDAAVTKTVDAVLEPVLASLDADEIKGNIKTLVDEAVAEIPVPEDGKSVTLEDVQPIIDAEIKAIRETVIAEVDATKDALTQDVTKAIASIRVPEDGKSVEPEVIKTMVEEAVAALPQPKDGVSVDMDVVKTLVTETLESWPKPKDGESVTLDQVQPLIETAVAEVAKSIPVPKDAADIADALIDRDGNLVLTLTDGRMKSLGLVVGRSVDQDAVEKNIAARVKQAVEAIPVPKDGDDGLGFDDMSVEHDGERTIVLRWSRGDVTKEAAIKMPIVIYRGLWTQRSYEQGDQVTWGGSTWTARGDTSEKPGEGKTDWVLTTKKGRDATPVVHLPKNDKSKG